MTRALVLAGGGVVGIAWLIGLVDGLRSHGLDLAAADLLVGTSAGAAVAVQIATGQLEHAVAMQQAPTSTEIAVRFDAEEFYASISDVVAGATDRLDANRRIANVPTIDTGASAEQRRAAVAARLPEQAWPARRLLITAVDALSGERVVFDRTSGVDLLDAVCASCAVPGVWPRVPIDGRDYVDGGVHSSTNADLAAGADRTLIVVPGQVAQDLADRIAEERASLAASMLVRADEESVAALGTNPLDPADRGPAFAAGRTQAGHVLDAVQTFWEGT